MWLPVELQTEILPFLAKLDIPLESSGIFGVCVCVCPSVGLSVSVVCILLSVAIYSHVCFLISY